MNENNELVKITKKEFDNFIHKKIKLNEKENRQYESMLTNRDLHNKRYNLKYYLNLYSNKVFYKVNCNKILKRIK